MENKTAGKIIHNYFGNDLHGLKYDASPIYIERAMTDYASLQCAEMKKELERLRLKWEDKLALHRRVCADPLMYTKEDRLKNSHYAQAIAAFLSDLKSLYNKETINHDTINKP